MKPARPQPHIATIHGVQLHYLDRPAAPGTATAPIFLLHSLLATAETWGAVIAGLLTDRRIVALDLLSAQPLRDAATHRRPRLDVHFAFLTELVHGLIAHLGLERPIIIGHSHGGALALSLATTHANLASALVLMAPAHPFGGYRSHVVDFYLKQPGRALALSIPLAPGWMILRAYNEACGPAKPLRRAHLKPYLKILRDRNALRRVLQMLHTWDDDMSALESALTTTPISIPTLLLWGEADFIVPPTSAHGLRAHLTNSQLVTLPAMGHLLADEAPTACAGFITTWLRETL